MEERLDSKINKALFWDFDGTLVHSGPLWSNAVFEVLKQNSSNSTITFDQIRSYMKIGFPWHTPEKDFTHITNDLWWEYMFEKFSDAYVQLGLKKSVADTICTKVKDTILDVGNYKLYEDAISTLEQCMKLGYKNYIVSNNYPELEDIAAQLNLKKYFSGFIISGKIGYDKPRKEIFEYALELANNPTVCYMIGDNPNADVKGANGAGIMSILVHNEHSFEELYHCNELTDIMKILK